MTKIKIVQAVLAGSQFTRAVSKEEPFGKMWTRHKSNENGPDAIYHQAKGTRIISRD